MYNFFTIFLQNDTLTLVYRQGVPKRLPTLTATTVPKREEVAREEFLPLTPEALKLEKSYCKVDNYIC